jgi:hypothetical protein
LAAAYSSFASVTNSNGVVGSGLTTGTCESQSTGVTNNYDGIHPSAYGHCLMGQIAGAFQNTVMK